jgi:hypothetical protein
MKREEETIKYRVVITTSELAASFYGELCAFVTGQVSEIDTSNSRRFRASAEIRSMFEKAMERRLGSDKFWSPVYPCEDVNSFELYFKEKPTKGMLKLLKEGCDEFSDEKKEKNPIMTRISIKSIKVFKERTLSVYEETEEPSELDEFKNAIEYLAEHNVNKEFVLSYRVPDKK